MKLLSSKINDFIYKSLSFFISILLLVIINTFSFFITLTRSLINKVSNSWVIFILNSLISFHFWPFLMLLVLIFVVWIYYKFFSVFNGVYKIYSLWTLIFCWCYLTISMWKISRWIRLILKLCSIVWVLTTINILFICAILRANLWWFNQ